jgi:serine protease Do
LSKQGEIILAVGNPNGYSYFGSITMGIISGLDRYFDIDGDKVKDMFVNYIQHDAAINSGNSGGALFNLKGEVIGINVIKIAATEIEGMGFAIPGDLVARICSDIEIYGVSRQVPVLGITFVDIKGNPEYFAYYNIPIPSTIKNGFYVTAVTLNASLYGYAQVGDIVTQIGDVVIIDTLDFKANFSKYRVGDIIDVIVYRNGAYLTLENIVLRARP